MVSSTILICLTSLLAALAIAAPLKADLKLLPQIHCDDSIFKIVYSYEDFGKINDKSLTRQKREKKASKFYLENTTCRLRSEDGLFAVIASGKEDPIVQFQNSVQILQKPEDWEFVKCSTGTENELLCHGETRTHFNHFLEDPKADVTVLSRWHPLKHIKWGAIQSVVHAVA